MTGVDASYGITYPFEDPDRQAGDTNWRQMGLAYGEGIINDATGLMFNVTTSPSDRTLQIRLDGADVPGNVFHAQVRIRGLDFRATDATRTITLSDVTAGYTRADRIVARWDPTSGVENIQIIKVEGSEVNTGTPQLPVLQRDVDAQWDIPLWHFVGGNVATGALVKTDDRVWVAAHGAVANKGALDPNAPLGAFCVALDTDTTYIRKLVGNLPTWIDRDAPQLQPLTLQQSRFTPVDTDPQFSKVRGWVQVVGSVSGNDGSDLMTKLNAGTDLILATLPPGYRPPPGQPKRFVLAGSPGQTPRCAVDASGTIRLYGDGLEVGHVYLDPIGFYAGA